jgi:hypothetical protein
VAILQQIGNGTPPSAAGRNVVAIVKLAAPWLKPIEVTVRECQKIGYELTTVQEALSARQVAEAYAIKLIGFDETTDRHEPSITSNLRVQMTEGAPFETVILKAAYLATSGGTSEAIVAEIEGKCFERLRDLLRRWKKYFEKLYPSEEWTGPDPERCSLHRLAGGGGIISDTCNAARKAKRLLAELIQNQATAVLREEMGAEAWDALRVEEKADLLRVHLLDCHQHMRNIFLNAMWTAQTVYTKSELEHDLKEFTAFERMSTEYSQLLRATYKEFNRDGHYYKGQSSDFASWMLEHYPEAFMMHVERAEGGRQDLDYDAAVPICMNRLYFYEYLHYRIYSQGREGSNMLEDFLFTAYGSLQFIAMSRANTLIDLRISRPLRWLAGMTSQLPGWSPVQMNGVLDLVEQTLEKAKTDGAVLLQHDLDIFGPVAATQPLFADYCKFMYEQDCVLSPSGKSKFPQYQRALAEILDPQDETNKRTRAKTIEYLQVQCVAGLAKMHDPKLALASKLTSQNGVDSIGRATVMDKETAGMDATNDGLAESVFGAYKYCRRRNPGIGQRRASGLAQEMVMKRFSTGLPERIMKRPQKPPAPNAKQRKQLQAAMGYFHRPPYREQVALVEMARAEQEAERALDRADVAELDAHRGLKRQTNSAIELESLIKRFALALSFYDRYTVRGVKSVSELTRKLRELKAQEKQGSMQLQLDWLREQIEMRVVGLGWVEFKSQWSSGSDVEVGTVADLIGQLKDILEEETDREIPAAAVAPIMQRKSFNQLGTPTRRRRRRLQISGRRYRSRCVSLCMCGYDCGCALCVWVWGWGYVLIGVWSFSQELRVRAEAERARLEAECVLDSVGDMQPSYAPVLDDGLVGKQIDIRWRYWEIIPNQFTPSGAQKKKQVFIWCVGTVVEVADGTVRKSERSEKALPAGALRIRWAADAEFEEKETLVWSIFNPEDWNHEVPLGWRWAPSELVRMRERREAEVAKARA